MPKYLIWSEEHGAWWRPSSRGYTDSLKLAGRYSADEAARIVTGANLEGSLFNECAFPVPADLDDLAARKTQR